MAVKFLVSGLESSGKSTMTSKIKDALVINFDDKEYNFETPNSDFRDYKGIGSVFDFINNKLVKYKEVKGEFPKVLVIDTVTQMYASMTLFNLKKYRGFDTHSNNNFDTLEFNKYLEDVILANGVDVVIVAHAQYDDVAKTYKVPAQGKFKDNGSWVSVVNDAIFIDKTSGKLTVYLTNLKYPVRYTLDDLPEKLPIDEFDINEHLDKLRNKKDKINKQFKL